MDEVLVKIGNPISSSITLNGSEHWIMRLTDKGIFFNREVYTDASPDDFAKVVIDILENSYDVTFNKKQPPYNRINNG